MINNFSNNIRPTMPHLSTLCYAAAAAATFKQFGMTTICKIGNIVHSKLGNEEDATRWDQSKNSHWKAARKTFVRDVSMIGSFIIAAKTFKNLETSYLNECIESEWIKKSDYELLKKSAPFALGYLLVTMPIAHVLASRQAAD